MFSYLLGNFLFPMVIVTRVVLLFPMDFRELSPLVFLIGASEGLSLLHADFHESFLLSMVISPKGVFSPFR